MSSTSRNVKVINRVVNTFVTNEGYNDNNNEIVKYINDKGYNVSIGYYNLVNGNSFYYKENKIYYDEIVFDVKDKRKYCKDNNINIMIEDDPINLRKLLSNTNILVFDYPYNRNKEFFNLTRVYSWYDTYYRIKCIKE